MSGHDPWGWLAPIVEIFTEPGEPPHLLQCYRGEQQVDILLPVVAYQQDALSRALDHVLTIEDVLVHKLIAWRHRDRDDIRSILSNRSRPGRGVPRALDRRVGAVTRLSPRCRGADAPAGRGSGR